MSSLFITRQNVPSVKEWRAGDGKEAPAKLQALGAVCGAWMPDAVNNKPAIKAVIKVPATARANFLSGGGVGTPGGPSVQFEEHIIDTEVGLGGANKLTGAAMMTCRLTLACSLDDFRVTWVESITPLYPGLSKAYLCKLPEQNGDERVMYVVFFDATGLLEAKLSHDLSKSNTAFYQFIEQGVLKRVEVLAEEVRTDVLGYLTSNILSDPKAPDNNLKPPKVTYFDWAPEVPVAFDNNNKGGMYYKVEIWGRINGELMAKLDAACEFLAKHQHTFTYTTTHVIEADLEFIVLEKCGKLAGKAKDHMRLHASGPLVLLNGAYLGSIREFESWAKEAYGYLDKTIDALYAKRARGTVATYMERHSDTKDFVYLDMAYVDADGTHVAVKPRIIIELYKNLLPKAAFNMTTMCEDKLAGTDVHRIVQKGWVQMGAGLGDVSVFGGTFEDECFSIKHRGCGDVAMASTGPHSNATQFYIALDKLEWLDGQKVVFGRVVDGIKAVKAVGRAECQTWNQRPKLRHYIVSSGKLTPSMVRDKRKALHVGVASKLKLGAALPPPQVLQIGEEVDPKPAKPAAAAAAAAEGGEGEEEGSLQAAASPEPVDDEAEEAVAGEQFDMNSYDDDAHKAVLKMQQAGRGMLARKHAKVLMELKHSETIAGLSPAQLWEVLGNFEAQALQDGGWYDAIPHKGENVLGSRRTVLPGRGWWTGAEREETLVTRNPKKMWLGYAIVGPKETLDKAKYVDCSVTWKIRAAEGGDGAQVTFVVHLCPKEGFTEEQIAPSWKTEFVGTLEALLTAVRGDSQQEPPPAEAEAPPG